MCFQLLFIMQRLFSVPDPVQQNTPIPERQQALVHSKISEALHDLSPNHLELIGYTPLCIRFVHILQLSKLQQTFICLDHANLSVKFVKCL